MHRIILSAPFGNYLNFPRTTPTLGTFTTAYRGGLAYRLWRVVRTVRYYRRVGAWVNRLGLPNPGIASLTDDRAAGAIVSVKGFSTEDWINVIAAASVRYPLSIELNVSCPNVDADESDYEKVYRYAASISVPVRVIVKLPPVNYERHVSLALSQGLTNFHCCNTLPTPGGGLSGKPLKALSLATTRYVVSKRAGLVIGGGGVTNLKDASEYLQAGATHVAVGSALFFPWNWWRIRRIAAELAI